MMDEIMILLIACLLVPGLVSAVLRFGQHRRAHNTNESLVTTTPGHKTDTDSTLWVDRARIRANATSY